jgi:GDSL-like lipase/acylhydrolase family protein
MSDPEDDFLIRLNGDSLSMPRAAERISYRQTYAELLCRRIEALGIRRRVVLYNRSRGGITIDAMLRDFREDSFFFGKRGGELLIIQAGVVDCAPRPLSRLMRKGVGMLPAGAKARAIRLLHDHRAALLKRGMVFRQTSPERFAEAYAAWIGQACEEFRWVYAINIAPTNLATEARSPGFGESVLRYNAIIADACRDARRPNVRVIDVHNAILHAPDGVNRHINDRDGHHLTAEGHRLYCDLVFSHIPSDFVSERARG